MRFNSGFKGLIGRRGTLTKLYIETPKNELICKSHNVCHVAVKFFVWVLILIAKTKLTKDVWVWVGVLVQHALLL